MQIDIKAFNLLLKGKYLVSLLISIFLLTISFRITASFIAIVLFVLVIGLPFHRNIKLLSVTWYIFLILSIVPVDITFINLPGPPKIVPYVKGLPSKQLFEEAKRGEVVLGGCVISGFEPWWVVVW